MKGFFVQYCVYMEVITQSLKGLCHNFSLVLFKMLSTSKYNYQPKFAFLLLYQVLVYIDL